MHGKKNQDALTISHFDHCGHCDRIAGELPSRQSCSSRKLITAQMS
jgi:hypothetical protein